MKPYRSKLPHQQPSSTIILAAGGIVWRRTHLCSKIAVIHRTRYGGEWCLPKGKLYFQKDKSLEDTALREVKEETGCDAKIINIAGTTAYTIKGQHKVVFFWNMKVHGNCSFKPSEEVDQVVWLSPREALKRLDHIEEKKLLTKKNTHNHSLSGLWRFNGIRSSRYDRLASSLSTYNTEIGYRIHKATKHGTDDPCWVKVGRKLLSQAEIALQENNQDKGWKCFHAARRMEIFGLTEEELKPKAALLRYEAEKLGSWRKKGTYEIIGTIESPQKDVTHEQIYQATLLRDEHYDNQAYKDRLLRNHVGTLVFILLLVTLTIFAGIICNDWIPLEQNNSEWKMLMSVALFGLLGGTFSAVLKVPASAQSSRIPELVQTFRLTLLRVSMGTISAIVIYIFLKSQFAADLLKMKFSEVLPYTYYAISFAAGFSERLVLKAVGAVLKEKE